MSRDEYLKYFGKNFKRHHKTSIGPTQRGKTEESIQSLNKVITPQMQVVAFSAKPPNRDKTMESAADRLHLKVLEEWPPATRKLDRRRGYRGYVLRPHQNLHPNMTAEEFAANRRNITRQFRKAMMDCYAAPPDAPVIQLHDEAHRTQNEFKDEYGTLKGEYEAPLMSGLPDSMMNSNIQRGRYSSYLAYDAPEWILFFQEPDTANTMRYAQMVGGVNRIQVTEIVEGLKTYEIANGMTISEFLLVRRSGPQLIVVDIQ